MPLKRENCLNLIKYCFCQKFKFSVKLVGLNFLCLPSGDGEFDMAMFAVSLYVSETLLSSVVKVINFFILS